MRGWYIGAAFLAAVGMLFVVLDLRSPSIVYWTGDQVAATSEHGLVDYVYRGTRYTIDNERQDATATEPEQVVVFVDPAHPDLGMLETPARWVDAAVVVLWFLAAAIVLVVGAVRTRRRRTRMAAERDRAAREDAALRRRSGP